MLETKQDADETALVVGQTSPGSVGGIEREFTVKERTQWQMAFKRFLKHRLAVVSVFVFILLVLFAFVLPIFWKYKWNGPFISINDINQGPSLAHPFGTSTTYDEMSQIMRGTAESLKVAFTIAIVGTGLGALWGVVSGYFGGAIDSLLMRLADLMLTIPALALAGALAAHGSGAGLYEIGLILAVVSAPYVARVVRGVVLSLREREFVEAARALGAGNWRIMLRHLLPNAFPVVLVNATLLIAQGILLETALSYVGLGIQPPDTSLGLLITQGQASIESQPWEFYFPGLFIILIALSVNFIGDGLRDALDPQQTRNRR